MDDLRRSRIVAEGTEPTICSDIGDFHGLCVGFVVFWVGSPHMGGGALFAAKPGYAQPLGALGLNYSMVLSAWKYHARPLVYAI